MSFSQEDGSTAVEARRGDGGGGGDELHSVYIGIRLSVFQRSMGLRHHPFPASVSVRVIIGANKIGASFTPAAIGVRGPFKHFSFLATDVAALEAVYYL